MLFPWYVRPLLLLFLIVYRLASWLTCNKRYVMQSETRIRTRLK